MIVHFLTIFSVGQKSFGDRSEQEGEQEFNFYYGRFQFEDDSPAIVAPIPWRSASTYATVIPHPKNYRYHLTTGLERKQGRFQLYLSDELLQMLRSGKHQIALYCPLHDIEGGRCYRLVGIFPPDLLVRERSQAKVEYVKRPLEVTTGKTIFCSQWTGYGDYGRQLLERHKDKYIAEADKTADIFEWGIPQNDLRCKLVCSSREISKGDPLFFRFHIQNAGVNSYSLNHKFWLTQFTFSLKGKYTGFCPLTVEPYWFDPSSPVNKYVTIQPGEILQVSIPVVKLATYTFSDIDAHVLDSTDNPGIYRIQATYNEHRSRNYPGWWEGKIASNEITLHVRPRVKDVYEDQLSLNKDIPLILHIGPQNNPYIIQSDSLRFVLNNGKVSANLKISFRTSPLFSWQIELVLVGPGEEVLRKQKTTISNQGKAKIIDRTVSLPLGSWNQISNAKTFRLSFIVTD